MPRVHPFVHHQVDPAPVGDFALDVELCPLDDPDILECLGGLAPNNDVVPLGFFFLFAVVVAVTLAGGELKRNEFPAVLESLDFWVFPDVANKSSSVQVCHFLYKSYLLFKVHQD